MKYVFSHTDFMTRLGTSRVIDRLERAKPSQEPSSEDWQMFSDSAPPSTSATSLTSIEDTSPEYQYIWSLKCSRKTKHEFVRFGLILDEEGASPTAPPRLLALSNMLSLVNNNSKMRQLTHAAFASLLRSQTEDETSVRDQIATSLLDELEEDGCTARKSYWNKPSQKGLTLGEEFQKAIQYKTEAISGSLFVDFPLEEVIQADDCTRHFAKQLRPYYISGESRKQAPGVSVVGGHTSPEGRLTGDSSESSSSSDSESSGEGGWGLDPRTEFTEEDPIKDLSRSHLLDS